MRLAFLKDIKLIITFDVHFWYFVFFGVFLKIRHKDIDEYEKYNPDEVHFNIITLKVVDSETQDHCWKIHISVQSHENDI